MSSLWRFQNSSSSNRNLQQFRYFGLCLGTLDDWSLDRNRFLVVGLVFLPNLALMIVAVSMDFFTRKQIQVSVGILNKSQGERRKLEKIPKRAALINHIQMGIWLSFSFVQFLIENEEDKIAFWRFLGFGLNGFRTLVVSRFAFQINEQIKRDDVDERRKNEIEHAIQARQERRTQNPRVLDVSVL